jgi:hypothetical protein
MKDMDKVYLAAIDGEKETPFSPEELIDIFNKGNFKNIKLSLNEKIMKEREESIKEGDIESAISLLQSGLAIEDVANIYNLTMEELKLRLEKL